MGRHVSQRRQFTMDNAEACVKTASRYIQHTPSRSDILSAAFINEYIYIYIYIYNTIMNFKNRQRILALNL
jgi:hypothetical protein